MAGVCEAHFSDLELSERRVRLRQQQDKSRGQKCAGSVCQPCEVLSTMQGQTGVPLVTVTEALATPPPTWACPSPPTQPTTATGCHFQLEMSQGFPGLSGQSPSSSRPTLMAPSTPHSPTFPCENTGSQEAPGKGRPLRNYDQSVPSTGKAL